MPTAVMDERYRLPVVDRLEAFWRHLIPACNARFAPLDLDYGYVAFADGQRWLPVQGNAAFEATSTVALSRAFPGSRGR
jgi:hypothetical protein